MVTTRIGSEGLYLQHHPKDPLMDTFYNPQDPQSPLQSQPDFGGFSTQSTSAFIDAALSMAQDDSVCTHAIHTGIHIIDERMSAMLNSRKLVDAIEKVTAGVMRCGRREICDYTMNSRIDIVKQFEIELKKKIVL